MGGGWLEMEWDIEVGWDVFFSSGALSVVCWSLQKAFISTAKWRIP